MRVVVRDPPRVAERLSAISRLLARGVAYHHSGMLPILREYVELCFQQRLVKLVFATETLAVGVNMPARCVAFTQLDKPDDTGAKEGHRWLRVDEFWQMAGRAGRRGLDTVGYVVYAPTLSVAGLRNVAPVHELNRMLTGDVAPATSQLDVDRPFVLRHLARGHDVKILTRTLRADELQRETAVAKRRLANPSVTGDDLGLGDAGELAAQFARYDEIERRLAALDPTAAQGATAMGVRRPKLSQKDAKKLQKERRELLDAHPGFVQAKDRADAAAKARSEIAAKESELQDKWTEAKQWLVEAGFVDGRDDALTPRGRCAAAFSDGEPLIVGTCVADGALEGLALREVCAFLCLFIPNRATSGRKDDTDGKNGLLPLLDNVEPPSPALVEVFDYADELAAQLHKEPLDRTLALLMLDWCRTKDIHRIAQCVDPHLLGSFVKAVMRVLSYVDVVREVLLGLAAYETHNRLDNHADALLHGLVTNESLYLRIDDD